MDKSAAVALAECGKACRPIGIGPARGLRLGFRRIDGRPRRRIHHHRRRPAREQGIEAFRPVEIDLRPARHLHQPGRRPPERAGKLSRAPGHQDRAHAANQVAAFAQPGRILSLADSTAPLPDKGHGNASAGSFQTTPRSLARSYNAVTL